MTTAQSSRLVGTVIFFWKYPCSWLLPKLPWLTSRIQFLSIGWRVSSSFARWKDDFDCRAFVSILVTLFANSSRFAGCWFVLGPAYLIIFVAASDSMPYPTSSALVNVAIAPVAAHMKFPWSALGLQMTAAYETWL